MMVVAGAFVWCLMGTPTCWGAPSEAESASRPLKTSQPARTSGGRIRECGKEVMTSFAILRFSADAGNWDHMIEALNDTNPSSKAKQPHTVPTGSTTIKSQLDKDELRDPRNETSVMALMNPAAHTPTPRRTSAQTQ
ncbi:uncharacterized protein [Panulirus ornatus]|uniref:uncharacterized protein n=1 Tax=Panulirus ornatus TaxID=150431 RepID=UPI003A8B2221